MNDDEKLNQESANPQESNQREETINSESSKNTVDTKSNESSSSKSTNEESDHSKKAYQPGDATKIVLEVCLIIIIITVMVAIIPGIYRTSKNWFKTAEDTSGLVASASTDLRDTLRDISSGTKTLVKKGIKEGTETGGKIIETTGETLKEAITIVSGEKQATDTLDLPQERPIKSYISSESNLNTTMLPLTDSVSSSVTVIKEDPVNPSLDTKMEYTEVIVKEEKKEYVDEFFISKNQQAKFERNFYRKVNEVSNRSKHEIKKIFEEVQNKIPDFVENHYEERSYGARMVSLMEKELLKDETLEVFIVNTAKGIDDAFFDSVNEALNDALMSIDLGTDTAEELRKRLPTAREICNQIYIDLMNKKDPLTKEPKYTERVNELGNVYDNWKLKHPVLDSIGKTGFVVIIAYLFPPSLYVTVPALLADVAHSAKINKIKNDFRMELSNQFAKQGRIYEQILTKAIKDISKGYVDLIIKAKVKSIKTDNGDNNKYSIEFPMYRDNSPKE